MARLYLTAHPYGVNAIGYQGIDERVHDQIEARGDRMLTENISTQRKWHRCAELVILAFVVTIFSSCSKSESADMSFLALLGGGGGEGAAPTVVYPSASYSFVKDAAIAPITPTITAHPLTNCVASPTLAAGLSINATSCTISGTPTTVQGASGYTITASNSYGTGTTTINIEVTATGVAPTVSYAGSPFIFTEDTAITPVTPTLGGSTPASCSSDPALPAGLTLNSTSCAISGTPTATQGSATYTITATNAYGSGQANISITVNEGTVAPTVTYSGSPFSFTKDAVIPTITPTLSGSALTGCTALPILPVGLTLNSTTCSISGTPTVTQAATNHTITATNSAGSGQATIKITVNVAGVAPTVSYAGSPYSFTQNTPITTVTPTLGGNAPTSCSSDPALPAGLSINSTSCAISGTPTATQAATDYTITATNAYGSGQANISIEVTASGTAPTVGYVCDESHVLNTACSGSTFTFSAAIFGIIVPELSGGTPTSCSSDPALPAGLSINSTNCAIFGTPAANQAATDYTITATNAYGSGQANISIELTAAPEDDTPPEPGASGTLTVIAAGSDSVSIQWAAATDDVSGALALEYRLYYSTSGNIDTVANIEANGTPVGDYAALNFVRSASGLNSSTNYYFNVIVKDAAGNKAAHTMLVQATMATWNHQAFLKGANTESQDMLGWSTAISGDTIVVGAPGEDSNTTTIIHGADLSGANDSGSTNGAAYIFVRSGGNWSQQAYLKAPNTSDGDWFGASVAIDGNTVVIGAPREGSNTTSIINGSDLSGTNDDGSNNGAVYVYTRSGSAWSMQAYLKPTNPSTEDLFGDNVDISGNTIAVASPSEDSNTTAIVHGSDLSGVNDSGLNNGAVYVFARTGSTWVQEAYLKAPNSGNADEFGGASSVSSAWPGSLRAMALSGNTIAVGAWGEDSNTTSIIHGSDLAATNNSGSNNGAVYVFVRNAGVWSHEAYLKAPNSGEADWFGYSVALDGNTIAVGAYREDDNTDAVINGSDLSGTNNSGSDTGAVYVFVRNAGVWSHQAYLKPNWNPAVSGNHFGAWVALHGDSLLVQQRLSGLVTSSRVYAFRRTGTSWAPENTLLPPNADDTNHLFGRMAMSGNTVAVGDAAERSCLDTIINGSDLSTATNDCGNLNGAVYVWIRE